MTFEETLNHFPKDIHPILEELWAKSYPMLIGEYEKTYIKAAYAVLKAVCCPGSTVCVVDGVHRRVKYVMDYIHTIVKKLPLLHSTVASGYYQKIIIGHSRIYGICTSNINTVRGQRCQTMIVDGVPTIEPSDFDAILLSAAILPKGQIVLCGANCDDFRHQYEAYCNIIYSNGDPATLTKLFKGHVPESFDWRDYSIINIPEMKDCSGLREENPRGH